MKRVIVFGATGNLGAYIALHLKSEGYDVIAVGGRKDDHGFFAERGMKYYSVDIRRRLTSCLPRVSMLCVISRARCRVATHSIRSSFSSQLQSALSTCSTG